MLPSTEEARSSELSGPTWAFSFSFLFIRFFLLLERGAGSAEEGVERDEVVEGGTAEEQEEEGRVVEETGDCCCACGPSLRTVAAGVWLILPSTEWERVRLLRLRERPRRLRSGACLSA